MSGSSSGKKKGSGGNPTFWKLLCVNSSCRWKKPIT